MSNCYLGIASLIFHLAKTALWISRAAAIKAVVLPC